MKTWTGPTNDLSRAKSRREMKHLTADTPLLVPLSVNSCPDSGPVSVDCKTEAASSQLNVHHPLKDSFVPSEEWIETFRQGKDESLNFCREPDSYPCEPSNIVSEMFSLDINGLEVRPQAFWRPFPSARPATEFCPNFLRICLAQGLQYGGICGEIRIEGRRPLPCYKGRSATIVRGLFFTFSSHCNFVQHTLIPRCRVWFQGQRT